MTSSGLHLKRGLSGVQGFLAVFGTATLLICGAGVLNDATAQRAPNTLSCTMGATAFAVDWSAIDDDGIDQYAVVIECVDTVDLEFVTGVYDARTGECHDPANDTGVAGVVCDGTLATEITVEADLIADKFDVNPIEGDRCIVMVRGLRSQQGSKTGTQSRLVPARVACPDYPNIEFVSDPIDDSDPLP